MGRGDGSQGARGDASLGGGGTLPVAGEIPTPTGGADEGAFDAPTTTGVQRFPPPGASTHTVPGSGMRNAAESSGSHQPERGLQRVPFVQIA